MGSLLTCIAEIIVVIGLLISAWATSAAVSNRNTQKAYLYGGITAFLGAVEMALVVVNCIL